MIEAMMGRVPYIELCHRHDIIMEAKKNYIGDILYIEPSYQSM